MGKNVFMITIYTAVVKIFRRYTQKFCNFKYHINKKFIIHCLIWLGISSLCSNSKENFYANLYFYSRDYYFCAVTWVSSTEVSVIWLNRAQNVSMVTLCKSPMWFCQEVGFYWAPLFLQSLVLSHHECGKKSIQYINFLHILICRSFKIFAIVCALLQRAFNLRVLKTCKRALRFCMYKTNYNLFKLYASDEIHNSVFDKLHRLMLHSRIDVQLSKILLSCI